MLGGVKEEVLRFLGEPIGFASAKRRRRSTGSSKSRRSDKAGGSEGRPESEHLFPYTALAGFLAFLLQIGCHAPSPHAPRGVVVYTVGALRADRVGFAGARVSRARSMDRAARTGLIATRAYATSADPLTSVSSALSGLLPPRLQERSRDHDSLDWLLQRIRESGRETHAVVAASSLDGDIPFDSAFGSFRRSRAWGLTSAVAEVRGELGTRPWFVWIHDDVLAGRPPSSGTRAETARAYDAAVTTADRRHSEIRRILDAEDVLWILMGTHGVELPPGGGVRLGHGVSDHCIRVPFAMTGPNLPTRRTEALISGVDIAPTVAHALGISAPASVDGQPLIGPAAGERRRWPILAFSDRPRQIAMRTESWKLVRGEGPTRLVRIGADPDEILDLSRARPVRTRRMEDELATLASSWARGESPGPPAHE